MAFLAAVVTGALCFGLLHFIFQDSFDSPQIRLVDITEKSSSGYKMFQVELTGLESTPNSAYVYFTNGIVSDKTNTAITFERGNAIISVIYQEISVEFSEFENTLNLELKAVEIDGWFIPLDDAKCYDIYCSEFNLLYVTIEASIVERIIDMINAFFAVSLSTVSPSLLHIAPAYGAMLQFLHIIPKANDRYHF